MRITLASAQRRTARGDTAAIVAAAARKLRAGRNAGTALVIDVSPCRWRGLPGRASLFAACFALPMLRRARPRRSSAMLTIGNRVPRACRQCPADRAQAAVRPAALPLPRGGDRDAAHRRLPPDAGRLAGADAALLAAGCDGIALFGTTGEGAEFASRTGPPRSRRCSPPGVPARRLDRLGRARSRSRTSSRLAAHATDREVDGVLLDAALRLSRRASPRTRHSATSPPSSTGSAGPDLRLYLYHFPEISGVPITPQVVRRLDERYPGIIAGVKDSGGDARLHRGSGAPLLAPLDLHRQRDPPARAAGGGRARHDLRPRQRDAAAHARDARRAHGFDRRAVLPACSRPTRSSPAGPSSPSVKAVLADWLGDPAWRRVIPPLPELPMLERQRLVADFRAWDAGLPAGAPRPRRGPGRAGSWSLRRA